MTDEELFDMMDEEKPVQEPDPVSSEKPQTLPEQLVTIGTPACGFLCAVLGVVIAVLLLAIGFWKTLFIFAAGAVGAFIGGVSKKSDWLKHLINKTFPPKH